MVVIVLAMASAAALLDRFDATHYRLQRMRDTRAAQQLAKAALLGYAVRYRDLHATESFGYLPCPDTKGTGVGQTPCGKAGEVSIGLLPWKTLGLPDLRDAEGNCLWYAVSGSFKASPKASPFNWDTQGQISVRDAAGHALAAPDDAHGGAAAVIVAPGPALDKQSRSGANGCSGGLAAGAFLENSGKVFINGAPIDGSGATTANDQIAWITPREIFDGVIRRRDFPAYMSDGIAAIRAKFGTQPAAVDGAMPADNPFAYETAEYGFYETWKDQFRYLRCANPGCYADGAGGRHGALLLFGGRSATAAPRPSSARSLRDYFESALALAERKAFAGCSADAARFDSGSPASRAADVALCLEP